jgi:hypothetical protein
MAKDLPRTKARKRGGRCYELAARALLNLPEDTDWQLVHGIVTGTSDLVRMDHAWLMRDELIWDAVKDERYPAAYYLTLGDAEIVAQYSRLEMCKEIARSGHYGPWVENAGMRKP